MGVAVPGPWKDPSSGRRLVEELELGRRRVGLPAYLRLAKRRGVLAELNRGQVSLSEFFESEYWPKEARRNLAVNTRKSYRSVWYVHLKPRDWSSSTPRDRRRRRCRRLREQMEDDRRGDIHDQTACDGDSPSHVPTRARSAVRSRPIRSKRSESHDAASTRGSRHRSGWRSSGWRALLLTATSRSEWDRDGTSEPGASRPGHLRRRCSSAFSPMKGCVLKRPWRSRTAIGKLDAADGAEEHRRTDGGGPEDQASRHERLTLASGPTGHRCVPAGHPQAAGVMVASCSSHGATASPGASTTIATGGEGCSGRPSWLRVCRSRVPTICDTQAQA